MTIFCNLQQSDPFPIFPSPRCLTCCRSVQIIDCNHRKLLLRLGRCDIFFSFLLLRLCLFSFSCFAPLFFLFGHWLLCWSCWVLFWTLLGFSFLQQSSQGRGQSIGGGDAQDQEYQKNLRPTKSEPFIR